MNVSTRIDDAAVRRGLQNSAAAAPRDAADAVLAAVERTIPAVQSKVPRRTSEYAASIDAGGTGRGAYVKAATPYARVLERGRPPMTIRAVGAAMTTPAGPRTTVHSPRYPARNVLRSAVRAQAAHIADLVETDLTRRVAARI